MKKIIDIMSHPPNYEVYKNKPRPKINWDIPGKTWVGIWGYDASNQIGDEILKITDSVKYEIWQPDLRADKIYEHTFETGVTHKLIPAISKKVFEGLKLIETVYSPTIINKLNETIEKENDIILILDGAPIFFNINLYYNFYKKIPVLSSFSGDPNIFFSNNYPAKYSLKQIHRNIVALQHKKYFENIKNAMVANIPSSCELLKGFGIDVYTTLIGLDFGFWTIDKSKYEARKLLSIPDEPFIIFSSSRLNELKQVDKLIEVLTKFKGYNFICYISGHGLKAYEEYLVNLIDRSELNKKVFLIGYIDDLTLKDYYLASDLFVTTSRDEGGPVSAWKAMALETPLFTTNTGNVIEVLKKFNAGTIVDTFVYEEWETKLKEIFNGKKINIIPRKEIEALASWKNVAKRYLDIYKDVFEKFYRRN